MSIHRHFQTADFGCSVAFLSLRCQIHSCTKHSDLNPTGFHGLNLISRLLPKIKQVINPITQLSTHK
jgi:hypothetical protein